ncbi:MAG: hypothetical protein Q7U02_02410 [Desulfosalsimonadaceae bacterium]|nr:hypothetical protein [Desulfosalsimonadaceae bacterium]
MSGRKNMMILLCIVSLIIMPLGASALANNSMKPVTEIGADTMFADLIAVRPLQLASLLLGTATFIVSLPFSALGDNVNQAYEMMMAEPARLFFKRPLGGF